MDDFYFSVNISKDRILCLAPITEKSVELSGQEIEDRSGYFLYERTGDGIDARIEIIAQVVSEEAVFRLREMFKMH